MEPILIIIFAAVFVIGGLILLFISLKNSSKNILNKEKYHSKWLGIENNINKNNKDSFHLAVINADSLLDQALKELGFKGNTMSERMNLAKGKINNYKELKMAHRIRNKLVHENNINLNYPLLKKILLIYKKVLKDIGAI